MIRRLVLVSALAFGSLATFGTGTANATDCSQKPNQCSGACHINWEATGPFNLVVCYA